MARISTSFSSTCTLQPHSTSNNSKGDFYFMNDDNDHKKKNNKESMRGRQMLIRPVPKDLKDAFKEKCKARGLKERWVVLRLLAAWVNSTGEPSQFEVSIKE